MHKRRIAIFLLPVIPLIFLTGWALYYFSRKPAKNTEINQTLEMGLLDEVEGVSIIK